MKTKHTAQLLHHVASTRRISVSTFCNLRSLTGLLPVAALAFLAFFAAANPSTRVEAGRAGGVTRQAFMRVTPQGVIQITHLGNSKEPQVARKIAESRVSRPLGITLW